MIFNFNIQIPCLLWRTQIKNCFGRSWLLSPMWRDACHTCPLSICSWLPFNILPFKDAGMMGASQEHFERGEVFSGGSRGEPPPLALKIGKFILFWDKKKTSPLPHAQGGVDLALNIFSLIAPPPLSPAGSAPRGVVGINFENGSSKVKKQEKQIRTILNCRQMF